MNLRKSCITLTVNCQSVSLAGLLLLSKVRVHCHGQDCYNQYQINTDYYAHGLECKV